MSRGNERRSFTAAFANILRYRRRTCQQGLRKQNNSLHTTQSLFFFYECDQFQYEDP